MCLYVYTRLPLRYRNYGDLITWNTCNFYTDTYFTYLGDYISNNVIIICNNNLFKSNQLKETLTSITVEKKQIMKLENYE